MQQEEGRARGSPGATAGGDSTLRGAALRDASLRGAALRDASLRGAALRAAALGGAAGPVRTARLHPATFRTLD
ncbi:pentapeptide repeat-containing protein [Frankia sp. Mgl5]|nr:pentapeptide repeat-containing protein [Frankia sp. Mgl5]